jgi:hypothetical protein
MGVKWPGYETDHPTPSSAKDNNERGYATTPTYAFMVCTGTTLPPLYPFNQIWVPSVMRIGNSVIKMYLRWKNVTS